MTDRFTPDQHARIKQAARDLLAANSAGKKCDPLGIKWANNILRANPGDPPPVAYDDDLPGEMLAKGVV